MTIPAPSAHRIDAGLVRDPAVAYPQFVDQLPTLDITAGRYRLRFARTEADLDAVLRLRFSVFNLELGEGLDASFDTGRDEDELDRWFHHLMIESTESAEIVGTYRMQTSEMANSGTGFYSQGEFDLGSFPANVVEQSVELGRACVSPDHRNGRVLHLLWRGLAAYVSWNDKRFLFGCCSLPTMDAVEGRRASAYLAAAGHMHPTIVAPPHPSMSLGAGLSLNAQTYRIPPLFASYLRLGALVCSPAAIDRQFKTIDFLVIIDTATLDPKTYRTFFRDRRSRPTPDSNS